MNRNQVISDLIADIKGDKSIVQPWRNKAVARLQEAQAFERMGRTSTYASTTAPDSWPADGEPIGSQND